MRRSEFRISELTYTSTVPASESLNSYFFMLPMAKEALEVGSAIFQEVKSVSPTVSSLTNCPVATNAKRLDVLKDISKVAASLQA